MANIKSAKKRARQEPKRRAINMARKSAVKTAIKKVMCALETGIEKSEVMNLLRDAEAQLARAKSKRVFHAKTACRKISRLAKQVSGTFKEQTK